MQLPAVHHLFAAVLALGMAACQHPGKPATPSAPATSTAPAAPDAKRHTAVVAPAPEPTKPADPTAPAPPVKTKRGLFAKLFAAGGNSTPTRTGGKFRWPWSKPAAPAAVEQATSTAPSRLPPYGLPPALVPDIKPREPETGLAPTTAPSASGKKYDPIDSIGLYPER